MTWVNRMLIISEYCMHSATQDRSYHPVSYINNQTKVTYSQRNTSYEQTHITNETILRTKTHIIRTKHILYNETNITNETNNGNEFTCSVVMTSRPYPLYVHRTIKVESILSRKFALWTYSPFLHEMSLLYLSWNILLRVLTYVCRQCNIKYF